MEEEPGAVPQPPGQEGVAPDGAEEEEAFDAIEHAPPRGTLVLMLVYLIILIGIFGSIYLTLLSRG